MPQEDADEMGGRATPATPKWLELIRVRSSAASLAAAAGELRRTVESFSTTAGAETLMLQHALYDGDLAIALIWRDQPQPQRTRLGLLLVAELEKLGSVDHAVWIPNEDLTQPQGV